ncbi:TPA: amino acid ABC transporter permease [Pseudomonas putida]|uniref:Glutamate/aspartate import permease protein GltK n=1 Tax=Pseudomonas putida TaxID=303 RepID=A0AAP9MYL0_PSEPU|nr:MULTISPECIES: amino acid ABC transporter permease [Pseudomonas]MCS4061327.1 polar amino acid transport system permease protein [Pseudomonas putida]MDD1993570.1 amino acid ABC transporter permease [Pseudomonas putida]PYB78894.1 amino acid ABC transporter permease [Pseudomonas sp. LB-090624]QJQ10202.1 amino acid ABC transporter permease [Pseudomonas putida]HDS0916523.1 amino acid ABC transporter permease [Pseudomonas putida]
MWEIIEVYWQQILVGQYPQGVLGGVALTLILSVLGLLISFPLSVAIALCRVSPWRALRVPATVLVYVVRGLPLVMMIFWSYFLVPLMVGHTVSGFTALLCTLIVYEAAYLSEVVRAGIESLPKGQTEAARSLGLSYWKTMIKVILPQALYNMVPSLISQFISTIKETSLGYVIGVQELTFSANQINTQLLTKPFEVFLILALVYFVVCFCLTQLAQTLEKRITRKRLGVNTASRSKTNDPVLQG